MRRDVASRNVTGFAVALAALLAATACSGTSREGSTGTGSPPSVVLVDVGTLRADHLGCYGYERPTSPAIDALAAESVVFEWAFAQAPHPAPAQASLLTGLYPGTHGMVSEQTRLPDDAATLAEVLAGQGYATAAFVDGGYLSAELGFDQGYEVYENFRGAGLAEIGPAALRWLRDRASEPFFLTLHTYDVHAPYDPPEQMRAAFVEGLEPPPGGFEPTAERLEAAASGERPLTEPELRWARALYDAEIRFVDGWVGRLMDELRALGLAERTVVILISDHGESFGEHGVLLHEGLHAPVVRVPWILRLPGGRRAGRIPHNVEAVDLLPTVVELAGAPLPPGVQGESLVPLVEGTGSPPYMAFGETPDGGAAYVALGGYHLIADDTAGTVALYRIDQDPLEREEVSEDEPERVEVMLRRLTEWRERVERAALGQEEAPLDDDTLEQLRSLGYVQ